MSSLPELVMPEILIGAEASAKATAIYAAWSDLLARIRSGRADGVEELYRLFARVVRFYLVLKVGPDDVSDAVNEVFIAVIEAIRRDELKEPERLMDFLRAVAQRQAAKHIQKKASHWLATSLPLFGDRSPSQVLEGREGTELVDQILTRIEHNIPS